MNFNNFVYGTGRTRPPLNIFVGGKGNKNFGETAKMD